MLWLSYTILYYHYPILSYTILGSRRIRENQGLIRISRGFLRFHHKPHKPFAVVVFCFVVLRCCSETCKTCISRNRCMKPSIWKDKLKELEILEICHEISRTSKPIYKIYKEFSKTIVMVVSCFLWLFCSSPEGRHIGMGSARGLGNLSLSRFPTLWIERRWRQLCQGIQKLEEVRREVGGSKGQNKKVKRWHRSRFFSETVGTMEIADHCNWKTSSWVTVCDSMGTGLLWSP